MTVAWQIAQDALKVWVEDQLKINVFWENEPLGWESEVKARLTISSSKSRGVDELRWSQDVNEPAGLDFFPTVSGNRDFTFTVLVESHDQRPDCAARWYLEKLRTSIQKPTPRALLLAAGIGFQASETVMNLDEVCDGRVISIASLDFHMSLVVNDRDTDEASSFVDKNAIAATLVDEGGNVLGWVSEEFGNVP